MVVCETIDSPYPYTEDGSWAGAIEGTCLETLTTLGFIAAATERIRLLTSVMVIPHRPAVLTAKTLATLDVLCAGRLTVGVGVGWMREEMAALGAPPYEQRGRASDEYIEAYRTLWREDVARYDGDFVRFAGVISRPKPVQVPGPPIWIGGEGPAARRRAARFGDGWYPVGRNPRHRLDTAERFAAALGDVNRRLEEAGRDPATLDTALFVPWARLGEPLPESGRRAAFTGPAAALREDIAAYEEAGLRVLVPNLETPTAAGTVERIEAFADAVGIG